MLFEDLAQMPYQPAWDRQLQAHDLVAAGQEERVLFVEHPPVITFGRRPGVSHNLLASDAQLATLGVQVVQSDRGGDITFHGPGQLVAYPIIRINDHHLSVGGYVHRLEAIIVDALTQLGVPNATTDPAAPGVWVPNATGQLAKICAIGVRIRRGVSMHGIALNVATDLSYFNLIIPCGLAGRPVTTLQQLMPNRPPTVEQAKTALQASFLKLMSIASENSVKNERAQ